MKTVHTNDMVAHLWAHRSQSEARNAGGSLYFRDSTIYSYGSHFPIARHVAGVVLLTTDRYRITTAKHQNTVTSACRHLPSFSVADVMACNGKQHAANFADYQERAASMLASAGRARKAHSIEWQFRAARELMTEANAYAEHFGLSERIDIPDTGALQAKAKELAAGEAEQRKAERAARMAKEKAQRAEYRQAIAEWQRGARSRLPWNRPSTFDRGAFLRLRGDTVETSQGAKVPADDARRAWPMIARCKAHGEEYRANGHIIRLGHFRLDKVAANGDVTAGCHFIKFAECERIAGELGVL